MITGSIPVEITNLFLNQPFGVIILLTMYQGLVQLEEELNKNMLLTFEGFIENDCIISEGVMRPEYTVEFNSSFITSFDEVNEDDYTHLMMVTNDGHLGFLDFYNRHKVASRYQAAVKYDYSNPEQTVVTIAFKWAKL